MVSDEDAMTDRFYTFYKTTEQLRRQGARGGRTYGRNEQARRALRAATPQPATPLPPAPPLTTTAESIAALDAQFPWLRGAEKRMRANDRPAL